MNCPNCNHEIDLHEHDAEVEQRALAKVCSMISERNERDANRDAETRKALVDALEEILTKCQSYEAAIRVARNALSTVKKISKYYGSDDALAKVTTAAICCPICAHITSYPADAQVVKCEHCLRSFQLEPTKKETPDGDNNKRTETH